MSRKIEINIDPNYEGEGLDINFDDYGVLLYYAFTVNQEKSLLLYKATKSEYHYRRAYEIPLEGLNESNEEVYIPLSELPELITFLKTEVIPSLEDLPKDLELVESWNIGNSLDVFLYQKGSFFEKFHVDEDVTEGFTPEYLIELFSKYLNVFESANSNNVKYFVRINA